MFSNHKENINKSENNVSSVYVGIGVAKILAINPTQEELASIIGDEMAQKFNTEYDLKPNYNGDQSRPVTIWVTDQDNKVRPTILNLNLVDKTRVSQNDNTQYFGYRKDKDGEPTTINFGWRDEENEWFKPLEEAKDGMEAYYMFLYNLLRWNDPETFVEALVENKLDFDTVYNGEFQGLRDLIDFINTNEINSMVMLFDARYLERDSGAMMVQSVVNRPNTWLRDYNGVNDFVIGYYRKLREKQIDAGYDVTKNFIVIDELQEYSDELRNKEIPTNTATDVSDTLESIFGV